MSRQVRLLTKARSDLIQFHRRAAKDAPMTALHWLQRFEAALAKLGENPIRCSIAPESSKCIVELRQLLFGRKPNVYRAIFTISDDTVRILRIRRAQQRWLTRRQVSESPE